MTNKIRTAVRIANLLLDQLIALRMREWSTQLDGQPSYVVESMQRFIDLYRNLCYCRSHNWCAAGDQLLDRAKRLLIDLYLDIDAARCVLESAHLPVPSMRNVLEDLEEIRQEFNDWVYDLNEQSLAVTTEPIVLEGVYLGPFEIRLQLRDLSLGKGRAPYRIIALDPHPAGNAEHVTHPHVSDERLCTGDASTAIWSALRGGRICDFFVLVRSVLSTYNSESPYVTLDDWEGEQCYECGHGLDDDSRFGCQTCGSNFCEDCIRSCRSCDNWFCTDCTATCPACDDAVCTECLKRCARCNERCCLSCLEDDLCPDCHQLNEEQNDEQDNAPPESGESLEPPESPEPREPRESFESEIVHTTAVHVG